MTSKLWFAAFVLAFSGRALSAQSPGPVATSDTANDPAKRDLVTAFTVRSGKLMLSSRANPGPVTLPDGAYTDETNTTIAFLNGRITRVQTSSESITEITNMRLTRQKSITLTPNTDALMAVGDIPLPSGRFVSEDGKSSVTIRLGRPVEFTLPPKTDSGSSR